jgi:protein-S-isoprenylcysteine O-methyltransferase Ste14
MHPMTTPLPEAAHMLAGTGIAVCAGAAVVVWVAGALYNALHTLRNAPHAPRERIRNQPGSIALIVVAVACAALAVASRSHFDGLAVGALWVRVPGLAVLVASTVFTLRARFSLGTMWSAVPQVKADHQLRTHGPYAFLLSLYMLPLGGCSRMRLGMISFPTFHPWQSSLINGIRWGFRIFN